MLCQAASAKESRLSLKVAECIDCGNHRQRLQLVWFGEGNLRAREEGISGEL